MATLPELYEEALQQETAYKKKKEKEIRGIASDYLKMYEKGGAFEKRGKAAIKEAGTKAYSSAIGSGLAGLTGQVWEESTGASMRTALQDVMHQRRAEALKWQAALLMDLGDQAPLDFNALLEAMSMPYGTTGGFGGTTYGASSYGDTGGLGTVIFPGHGGGKGASVAGTKPEGYTADYYAQKAAEDEKKAQALKEKGQLTFGTDWGQISKQYKEMVAKANPGADLSHITPEYTQKLYKAGSKTVTGLVNK